LVAETHAERRDPGLRHALDGLERDARNIRRAGAGRDDAPLKAAGEQLIDCRAIVAHRVHVGPQLSEVLHEVVGERVVVVDDEDRHVQSGCSQARAMARIAAFDFATASSCSYSGLASATVPPPAWTWATPSLTTTVRM